MNYWEKRKKAFGFALQGILGFFKEESHAQIHLFMAVVVILAGIFFDISSFEWMICGLCIGIVLISEMFNSSMENMVNLVSPQENKLAGRAKDLAAGAVLIASCISALIGLFIFVPKIWKALERYVN